MYILKIYGQNDLTNSENMYISKYIKKVCTYHITCQCAECWYVEDCPDPRCSLKQIEESKGLEVRRYD